SRLRPFDLSQARTSSVDHRRPATMLKSELVAQVAEQNRHLYQRDIDNIVDIILEMIAAALARGDRVELRGFGAFSVRYRSARIARNPRTGIAVRVAPKARPRFEMAK